MNVRTDLAMELPRTGGGVETRCDVCGGAETTRIHIVTDAAARRLGKPKGTYWTLEHPALSRLEPEERVALARVIAREITRLLPPEGPVLVVGLGNRRLTADALGSRTVEGVFVTRHLETAAQGVRSVCAMAPGVLGVTGVETAEMVRGVAQRVQPAALIVVDALAALESRRICAAVQVTDTGICPGSGVGNHRVGLTEETLGVKVIAVGIPMVVYAATIVRDALRAILARESSDEAAEAMAESLSQGAAADLVVTPRDVDETVAHLSDLLALAINLALQPGFTAEELSLRLH